MCGSFLSETGLKEGLKNDLHSGTWHLDGRLHRLRVLCSDRVHHRELHLAAGHQEQIRPQKLVSGGVIVIAQTKWLCSGNTLMMKHWLRGIWLTGSMLIGTSSDKFMYIFHCQLIWKHYMLHLQPNTMRWKVEKIEFKSNTFPLYNIRMKLDIYI